MSDTPLRDGEGWTPGPWTVQQDDSTVVIVCDPNNFTVCVPTRYVAGPGPAVTEANARLIAAAPELYEALLAMRDLAAAERVINSSFCEVCERHAPKNNAGEIVGPVPHVEYCPIGLATAALRKAQATGPA